ncbi:hypothetical protein G7Y89_g14021 [Cudoniella acicularis]|uniref:Peptidase A1 domain-containing protein n=1 Tax=Cudoniella acicularis TaxID=354080 RepID=A0A8H4R866_9HELO|nr:hypothetical protein G7Y89_g14021 [Cudoniella acicularis]
MKSSALTLAIGLAVTGVHGLTLEKRDNPNVVLFPIERSIGIPASGLRKRGTVETALNNEAFIYTVSIMLGTPPQSTRVQLDTGSSVLVVETDSSNLCASQPSVCSSRGAYDANSSSTYTYVNSQFSVGYVGGDGASGDYALDVLNIGGAVLQGFELGIMYKTTVQEGIFGVSYPSDPSMAASSLPIQLVQQGYIPSRAFSIYLNDDQGAGGSILFGGVDTDKYIGDLVTIPFVPEVGSDSVTDASVSLNGVQYTDPSGNTAALPGTAGSTPVSSILDTGTGNLILPQAIVSAISTVLNADLSSPPSILVDCSLMYTSATIDFQFQGVTIPVPLSQVILPNDPGETSTECSLNIEAATDNTGVILGDAFLSSAYVVFDYDNQEASLAPVNFNSTSENILQITSGPSAVPHVPGGGASSSTSGSIASSSSFLSTSSSLATSSSSVLSSQHFQQHFQQHVKHIIAHDLIKQCSV